MTREQKIDVTLEELDQTITIATYQEKQVRKCPVAAFARIESEVGTGGSEMSWRIDRILRPLMELDQENQDYIYFIVMELFEKHLMLKECSI